MRGRPVWLASVSRWKNGHHVPTEKWSDVQLRMAKAVSHEVLDGIGDVTAERGFLMCATLCVHRAVTDTEANELPTGPGYLAGPPGVRVAWETEQCPPISLSFQPCDNRRFQKVGPLTLPVDNCGKCPSCLARTKLIARIDAGR